MGTDRTKAWLQAAFLGRDPNDFMQDLLESVSNIANEAGGSHIWVSPYGDDTNGDGSLLRPYASFETGLAATGASKTSVIVLPGTYTENVEWPTTEELHLIGVGKRGAVQLVDASAGGTAVMKIKPETDYGGTAFNAYLDNITISHAGTGMYIDNATAAYVFNVKMREVDFVRTGGTSIITNHGAGTEIGVYAEGATIAGKVYLECTKPLDNAVFRYMNLAGGLASSADTELGGTANIVLASSQVKHEGVTGGATCQRFSSIFSWSFAGSATYALVDTDDLAGSHTESIIGS